MVNLVFKIIFNIFEKCEEDFNKFVGDDFVVLVSNILVLLLIWYVLFLNYVYNKKKFCILGVCFFNEIL